MRATKESAAHEFFHDRAGRVVHENDMVTVPAHAAADMEQDFVNELEDGRDFVREVFRGMEMAGVEAVEELVFDGVGEVEFVRADDIALRADAEEFALHGVEVEFAVHGHGENLVERGGEALAGRLAVVGHVLRAIGNPDIRDHRRAELLGDLGADLSTGDAVLDPELADFFIRMGERETVGCERV